MNYISTWDQFRQWIDDNGIVNWKISASRAPQNNELRFSYNDDKTLEENLDICRRRLESEAGRILYATGWRTPRATGGGFSCEIQFYGPAAAMPQPAAPAAPPPAMQVGATFDRATMIRDITLQVQNEFNRKDLERREKDLADREREYRAAQEGVMGLLVRYLAPVAQAFMSRGAPAMAGVRPLGEDDEVAARPIRPQEEQGEEGEEGESIKYKGERVGDDGESMKENGESAGNGAADDGEDSPFTDQEADRLLSLMARFKAVEPDYLRLLEAVVGMAERGEVTYNMAKGFLLR